MKLFHVTLASNLPSILQHGISPEFCNPSRARKASWFVRASTVEWAIVHVLSKPQNVRATLADLVVLEINDSAGRRRAHGKGLYWLECVTPAAEILAVRQAS